MTCPQCGITNPERAKFCLECGAALAGVAAAPAREERFLWLAGAEPMPDWLIGSSPQDHEPPPPPPPLPPSPPGVDPVRWAWADEKERKRMVRQARG